MGPTHIPNNDHESQLKKPPRQTTHHQPNTRTLTNQTTPTIQQDKDE